MTTRVKHPLRFGLAARLAAGMLAWLAATTPGLAQGSKPAPPAKPPATGSAPAPAATAGAPAATAPTAPGAPAPAAAPATAGKTFVVKVPAGGKYVITIPEAKTPPVQPTGDQATISVPTGLDKFTLSAVDQQTGYAARKELTAKDVPAEVVIAPSDLKLVHLVRVKVTGQGDKPVANGAVILTDSQGKTHQSNLAPDRNGEILFEDVAEGDGKVDIIPLSGAGSTTTKQVKIALAKGETAQNLPLGVPEVTDVIAGATPAAAPGTAPAADTPPATSGLPAAAPGAGTTAPAPAQPAPAAPAAPAAPPANPLPPPPADGGAGAFFSTILSWLVLIGIGFGVYAYGKKQGWTIEGAMTKLGITPQAAAPASAAGPASPVAVPPPPVVADPNRCQFCGEVKDAATGGCACTVGSGAAVAAGGFGGASVGSPGLANQPRLIGASGVYMGEIFPIRGEVVLGRDPSNSVPLDRDTTVSRRHARIASDGGGGFRITDEGSSNGTFVNGARVTDQPLHPGDEISVGGTRFRFEV